MSELLDKMEEYFKNTPKEKIKEDWKKSEQYDKVGITVDDLIKHLSTNELIQMGIMVRGKDGWEYRK